jgi:signal transduction histidine kinase
MSNTSPTPTHSDRIAWLRRINSVVSQWAASMSWMRLFALALIILIASAWIGDTLHLKHEKLPRTRVEIGAGTNKDSGDGDAPCQGEEIRIGGKNGIVLCDDGRKKSGADEPAGAPAQEASAASGERTGRDARVITERTIRRTLGGWLGDIFSAIFVAAFAYLVAAKIIVRKTAEADAKLRVATDSMEREAMQRQLVQARLKLLQAQVEPHFLFNTLAAVDYLIETDPPRASVMQKALISYLRAALPQMRQESSTLGRELALIRSYLELLKLRIEDRLDFAIQVPDGLRSSVFPPMVLQSLVENAIKHGIEPKPEGGTITVHAEVVDGELHVNVNDTGVGLPEGDVFGRSSTSTGLGLDNIRHRLSMLYPGRSRMELQSDDKSGTRVRLVIPYQAEAKADRDASR